MKQITWQHCVIGIESSSVKSDTLETIGARWRRRLVWKEKDYKDKLRYKEEKCLENEERGYALDQFEDRA